MSSANGKRKRILMNRVIREKFETATLPAFGIQDGSPVNEKGEYKSPIEDHWQTFQEGWEEAVKECCRILRDQMDDHFAAEQLKEYFDL